jgi:predicted nucleotidyltransferase
MAEGEGEEPAGGGVRLAPDEVAAIKATVREIFAANTVVRLFGSRVDDDLRGGDIDLHFEVDEGEQRLTKAADFRSRLFERLDEQKVDLVFHVRGRPLRPIDQAAFDEGVIL